MVFKREEYERKIVENFRGGAGKAIVDDITKNNPPKCRVFSEITLRPGCEIGYHKHEHEFEIFYVISGAGTLKEDDVDYIIKAGDTICCYDGSSHGVVNTGIEDLVLLAIIMTE